MIDFLKSGYCNNKEHCNMCRDFISGYAWRVWLSKQFLLPQNTVNFNCPYGNDWGYTKKQPKANKCKFAVQDCCGKAPVCSIDGGTCENTYNKECLRNPEFNPLP